MNYAKELQTIESFVKDEYYREAGRNCGTILEAVLKDIYRKVIANAPLTVKKSLVAIEEKISKGQSGFQSFMLGQLIGLFKKGSVFSHVETILDIPCKLSKQIPLDTLNEIRIKCTHNPEYTPTLQELSLFTTNLNILLSEMKYIETIAKPPPSRTRNILNENRKSLLYFLMILLSASIIFLAYSSLSKTGISEIKTPTKNHQKAITTPSISSKTYKITTNSPLYDEKSNLTFSLAYINEITNTINLQYFRLTWDSGSEAIKQGSRIHLKKEGENKEYTLTILSLNKNTQSIEIIINNKDIP